MKDKLLFVDAETDGLYGMFLSVAMVVTDSSGENILEEIYYGVKDAKYLAKDPWVKENVLSRMGDYEECRDEEELLEKAWDFWMKYEDSAYAVADVQYPVEARLFQKCVEKNEEERKYKAPFPLLDLSTVLYWEQNEPLGRRISYLDEESDGEVHNALYDAKMTAKIWSRLKKAREAHVR